MKDLKRFLKYATAVAVSMVGVFMMIGVAISFNEPSSDGKPPTPVADVIGFVLVGIVPCASGVLWFRSMLRRESAYAAGKREAAILRLAATRRGKLTAADLTMNVKISSQEAEQTLQDMTIKGMATLFVSETGVPVYHFRTLISDDEKNSAEEV